MAPRAGFVIGLVMLASLCFSVTAKHVWAEDGRTFHWARESNPVQMTVVNSMSNKYWDDRLRVVNEDWNRAHVFDGGIKTEYGLWTRKERQECKFIKGKVHACNANYGANDWAGLASIQIDADNHITACTAVVNDFWMSHESEKMHVLCQEVGHCWGLGHQSEDGTDLDTCMDYADARDNMHPDEHDFDVMDEIYTHKDRTNTAASVNRKLMGGKGGKGGLKKAQEVEEAAAAGLDPSSFGTLVKEDEREIYWEKSLADGTRVITHALKVSALKKAQQPAAKPTTAKQVADPVSGSMASTASS